MTMAFIGREAPQPQHTLALRSTDETAFLTTGSAGDAKRM